jgi:hypothetical protein
MSDNKRKSKKWRGFSAYYLLLCVGLSSSLGHDDGGEDADAIAAVIDKWLATAVPAQQAQAPAR